jgi:lipopolysaccharide biosynthesis protein
MKLEGQGKKRLAIYFFYDREGIVDDYVIYMLRDLKKNISELLVVCNGKLTQKSREKLESLTLKIFVREDKGFDVWAYKEGMEYYGWDKLDQFDEVVLMSYTVFGPLYPLKNMFDEMNNRDVDFWGVTLYNGSNFDSSNFDRPYNIPPHIQMFFLAIRRNMLHSPEFQQYWKSLPMFNDYKETISCHVTAFTKHFENKGFKWQVYVDARDFQEGSCNPLILAPLELVKNRKCPFIERNIFSLNYAYLLASNNGESTSEVMEYIEKYLNYDTNMIWDNILRLQNAADLNNLLHLNYILPTNISEPIDRKDIKTALIIHLFFEDLIEYCFKYAQSMPKHSDIYISTNTEEKRQAILKVFNQLECNKLTVYVIDNRGRDISALLVATKSYIMDYDYVCFVHTKKSSHMSAITGASWRYKCFENLLKNDKFVENVIATFEKNPRLGILVPPHPIHGDYYSTIGVGEWLDNFDNVVKLAEKLDLDVNIDPDKEPIAPLGSMFWFRSKAMKVMYEQDWKYSDFPEGNLVSDGTLHHAIERIHPFVVQHGGFYPAYVMSDSFARIENTNLFYMLRKLNKEMFKIYGLNSHLGLLRTIEHQSYASSGSEQDMEKIFRLVLKKKIKKFVPKPILKFKNSIERRKKKQ